MKLLWLRTTRISAVVLAFLERYPECEIKLDGVKMKKPVSEWCTNRRLKSALEFSLCREGVEILVFHDGPTNLWAHEAYKPFVEELHKRKLLRFSEEQLKPTFLSRLYERIFGK
jgi:hypothetical protein